MVVRTWEGKWWCCKVHCSIDRYKIPDLRDSYCSCRWSCRSQGSRKHRSRLRRFPGQLSSGVNQLSEASVQTKITRGLCSMAFFCLQNRHANGYHSDKCI
jgi:hypothetical protein